MPIESVKIPQNVYIEDRIIGPVTLRQIVIMLIGGGISYMLFTTLQKANGGSLPIPAMVIVWIPAAIAFAFAFVRINDLSLLRICLLAIERMNKPATRTWALRTGLVIHIRTSPEDQERIEKERKAKEQEEAAHLRNTKKIEELSTVMDHPLPVEEKEALATSAEQPQVPAKEQAGGAEEPAPRFPVDPNRIRVDDTKGNDGTVGHDRHNDDTTGGLAAFESVFRDISPS